MPSVRIPTPGRRVADETALSVADPPTGYSGGANIHLSGFFGENATGISWPMVGQLPVSTAICW